MVTDPTQETDAEVRARIRERFPDIAELIDVFPELGDIMQEAIDKDLSNADFDALIKASNWWTSRSKSARDWDTGVQSDPMQAERRRQQRTRTLTQKASAYGITLSEADLRALVEQSLRWGYTEDELNSFILSKGNSSEIGPGSISANADEITSLARSYLIGMTPQEANNYALKIGKGEMTLDGVRSLFRNQAAQAMPQFADQINNGFSITDATSGVRNQVANILGISADEIDFNDDRWTDLIDKVDESGNRRMMTRSEAGRWARTQGSYRNTDQANSLVRNLVDSVGKALGKIA